MDHVEGVHVAQGLEERSHVHACLLHCHERKVILREGERTDCGWEETGAESNPYRVQCMEEDNEWYICRNVLGKLGTMSWSVRQHWRAATHCKFVVFDIGHDQHHVVSVTDAGLQRYNVGTASVKKPRAACHTQEPEGSTIYTFIVLHTHTYLHKHRYTCTYICSYYCTFTQVFYIYTFIGFYTHTYT